MSVHAEDNRSTWTRRALFGAAGAGLTAFAASTQEAVADNPAGMLKAADGAMPPILEEPAFNVRALTRITSSLAPGRVGRVQYIGRCFGVDGLSGRTRPLYGIEGMGSLRALPMEGDRVRFLFAEFSIYTDLASGEPLREWRNPFNDRMVEVFHNRNGPVNYELDPAKPAFGAFERAAPAAGAGFRLDWRLWGDVASFTTDVVAERKNPFDPTSWPLESSGPLLNSSEHSQYFVRLTDLLDESKGEIPFEASLQSLKPWHPWMLMGAAPGRVLTILSARRIGGMADLSPAVAEFTTRELPGFTEPPARWTGEYVTANALYMKSRSPRR